MRQAALTAANIEWACLLEHARTACAASSSCSAGGTGSEVGSVSCNLRSFLRQTCAANAQASSLSASSLWHPSCCNPARNGPACGRASPAVRPLHRPCKSRRPRRMLSTQCSLITGTPTGGRGAGDRGRGAREWSEVAYRSKAVGAERGGVHEQRR